MLRWCPWLSDADLCSQSDVTPDLRLTGSAPEIWTSSSPGLKADIYSFGMVMLEIFTLKCVGQVSRAQSVSRSLSLLGC